MYFDAARWEPISGQGERRKALRKRRGPEGPLREIPVRTARATVARSIMAAGGQAAAYLMYQSAGWTLVASPSAELSWMTESAGRHSQGIDARRGLQAAGWASGTNDECPRLSGTLFRCLRSARLQLWQGSQRGLW